MGKLGSHSKEEGNALPDDFIAKGTRTERKREGKREKGERSRE